MNNSEAKNNEASNLSPSEDLAELMEAFTTSPPQLPPTEIAIGENEYFLKAEITVHSGKASTMWEVLSEEGIDQFREQAKAFSAGRKIPVLLKIERIIYESNQVFDEERSAYVEEKTQPVTPWSTSLVYLNGELTNNIGIGSAFDNPGLMNLSVI